MDIYTLDKAWCLKQIRHKNCDEALDGGLCVLNFAVMHTQEPAL